MDDRGRGKEMARRLGCALLASASIAALGFGSAMAQSINLDPIVVETPLDGVVVTTTKERPRPRAEAPQAPQAGTGQASEANLVPAIAESVFPPATAISSLSGASAVSRSDIETQFQPDRVSEILATIPGVATSETARDTAQAINIRGL